MIFHCLRHWVHNYHIDGFRFDLASILSRDRRGDLIPESTDRRGDCRRPACWPTRRSSPKRGTPPVPIRSDPFADGGDGRNGMAAIATTCGGFWRGDPGMLGAFATRLAGSARPLRARADDALPQHQLHHFARRLYAERPGQLRATKHNEANGEDNRDGDNNNCSDNLGVEGPNRAMPRSTSLRERQVKNILPPCCSVKACR